MLAACRCQARLPRPLGAAVRALAGRPERQPAPPRAGPQEKLTVLFPRAGSHQTSIEVKRRVLKSVPHMGGKRLKRMVREHARRGNIESFIGDFESRLDRVLYRSNLVPSIFAARHAIGHKHIMVNGKVVNSTHRLLKPGDIVEPIQRADSLAILKRMFRRRLANNTFVLKKEGPAADRAAHASGARAAELEFTPDALRDGLALAESYRRLPPPPSPSAPHASSSSSSSAATQLGPNARAQAQLDAALPALVQALGADTRLAAALGQMEQTELHAHTPAQAAGAAAPPATLVWRRPFSSDEASSLLTLNRVATRRLLLGLLALRPASGKAGGKASAGP